MRQRIVVLGAAMFGLSCTPTDDVPLAEQQPTLDEPVAASEVTRTPVACRPAKPTVQGTAMAAGGWLGEPDEHVRLGYPAGAFEDGAPLTLIAHPRNHGVRLAQQPNDPTLTAELRFRLRLDGCEYAGGDYYFLYDSIETRVDSIYEDDAWWAAGEVPLSSLRMQQDTVAALAPTGFVILSN